MTDVFLSYSSKDRQAAERVEQALSMHGMDVFWDQVTPPGVDWDTWTRTKLADAKAAVVLWSKNSIVSPNVRHEAMVARDMGKLVPAMIETLSPADFPMGLYLVQGVQLQDWRNPTSGGMERLVAEVQARLGHGAGATAGAGTAPAKPRGTPAIRKPSPVALAVAGTVVAAVLVGVGWLALKPDATRDDGAGSGTTSAAAAPAPSCTDGSVPAQGACISSSPISAVPATGSPALAADMFSNRMLGHWHWDGQSCDDGTDITLEEGKLVFATKGFPRYVHAIESDTALETHTRVLSPESDAGQQYTLTPEFDSGADNGPNFTLVLVNGDERDTWNRC